MMALRSCLCHTLQHNTGSSESHILATCSQLSDVVLLLYQRNDHLGGVPSVISVWLEFRQRIHVSVQPYSRWALASPYCDSRHNRKHCDTDLFYVVFVYCVHRDIIKAAKTSLYSPPGVYVKKTSPARVDRDLHHLRPVLPPSRPLGRAFPGKGFYRSQYVLSV